MALRQFSRRGQGPANYRDVASASFASVGAFWTLMSLIVREPGNAQFQEETGAFPSARSATFVAVSICAHRRTSMTALPICFV